MKVYVLTCINEEAEIVLLELFQTHAQARERMIESFNAECEELNNTGRLDYEHAGPESASCGNSEYYYWWKIHSREL